MNIKYYKDIEQMIVAARYMNEADFDRMTNKYLTGISEEEKDVFCQALAIFHINRINQYMDVNKELARLTQSGMTKENVNLFEMAV